MVVEERIVWTKQGGKIWYKTFSGYLTQEAGLIGHESDPCLFTSIDKAGDINSISSIYVNDHIIGGPDKEIEQIKAKIGERFTIKNLSIAKHIVGIQVEQLPESTLLTQADYIDEIL